jgi:putative redox protein
MANTDDKGGARAQAVVSDGLAGGAFRARAGTSEFAVGGQSGTDPYELLSVSLAACTAMTLRFHALRRKYSLSHLEVAVSYHHGVDDGRAVFERVIICKANLMKRSGRSFCRTLASLP